MDEERSGTTRLGSPLRPLLTYGIPYLGAGVWAFTKFPEQLRWTSDVSARVFGLAAPFYEDFTHVEAYGEALDAAIEALERVPTRVLDLCCGTGFAARQVQHAFPDAEVAGIDLSPEMVLMARREADEEGLDIEFEVDDAGALQLDDETFDLVISHNAPPFPDEAMRVLSPGGTVVTVWSFGGPWVGLAWPALAKRLRKAGALYTDGFRAGTGFYGIAEKSGIPRRRRARTNGSAAPHRTERAAARRADTRTRAPVTSRAPQGVPPPPPPSGSRGAAKTSSSRATSAGTAAGVQSAPAGTTGGAKRLTPRPRPARRGAATTSEGTNGQGKAGSRGTTPSAGKRSTTKPSTTKQTAQRPSPKTQASPPSSASRSRRTRGSTARPGGSETPPGDGTS